MKKLGFIGYGNMAKAMLKGALASGYCRPDEVLLNGHDYDKTKAQAELIGVTATGTARELARDARIVILSVKPNLYEQILAEIRDELGAEHIVLAIAPAYRIRRLEDLCAASAEETVFSCSDKAIEHKMGRNTNIKICRAMPNTPAQIGLGVTGYCFSEAVNTKERDELRRFLSSFGTAIEVKEEQMPAVGSVSGSSPAFVYSFIEALAQGAIRLGLKAEDAYQMAATTVSGAAEMVLRGDEHPARLRDRVCSPGGTTIAGVSALERFGFKAAVMSAMEETADRFNEMQDEADRT